MADPRFPYILGITLSAATSGKMRVYSRTNDEVLRVSISGDKSTPVDLANFETAYANGDVIEITTSGPLGSSNTTHTVDTLTGGSKIATITQDGFDTSTVGVSI